MKLTIKKSLLFFAVIAVLSAMFALCAFADELTYPASGWVQMYGEDGETAFVGVEGEDLKWTVDQVTEGETTEVVLTITGSKTTLTFNSAAAYNKMGSATIPWWGYEGAITKIVIEAPITAINQTCAFNKLAKVHTVVLPETNIDLSGSMIFAGMNALTTLGPEGTEKYTLDLRTLYGGASQPFDGSCANETENTITVLMPYGLSCPMNATKPFSNETKVLFKVLAGSSSEAIVNTIKSHADDWDNYTTTNSNVKPHTKYVTVEYYDLSEFDIISGGVEGKYAYTLDIETGALSITNEFPPTVGWQQFDTHDADFQAFKAAWGSFVKTATVEYFGKISFGNTTSGGISPLFAGMANLEKVTFVAGQRMQSGSTSSCGWFQGCTALKSVTFGGELVDGVVDLSGMTLNPWDSNVAYLKNCFNGCANIKEVVIPNNALMNTVFASTFAGCSSLEKVKLGDEITTIESGAFADCPNVVLHVYEDSYAHTWALENGVEVSASSAVPEIVEGEYKASDKYGSTNYKWIFDSTTGILTIDPTEDAASWNELKNAGIDDFKALYKKYVKHIVVGKFSKIQTTGDVSIFAGFPNLETILFTKNYEIQESSGTGLFENNPKLTAIGFGTAVTEGVVDISGIVKMASNEPKAMFKGCTSITKVVFKDTALQDGKNDGTGWGTSIFDSMFEGCTALETISLPAYITEVGPRAFAGCTALKTVNVLGTAPAIDETAFADVSGTVTLVPQTANDYAALAALNLPNVKVQKIFASPVSFDGFSIRLKDYNGLRGEFTFNKDLSELTEEGYSLVEYGAIVATAANGELYGTDLINDNGEYVTANEKVIKTAIYTDGVIVNKILEISDAATRYALSITNIGDDFLNTEIVIRGYAVFKDASGAEKIFYEGSSASLYEAALNIYKNRLVDAENDGGMVWETLVKGGAVTLAAETDFAVVENQQTLDGTAIGETFTFAEIPVVSQNVVKDANDPEDVGLMSYTASDVTVTLLKDGEDYVAVYRGTGVIPGSVRWGADIATVNQLSSNYLTNRGKGYAFPDAVPNPALTATAVAKIKTVIIDEGITGLGDELFNEMYLIKTVVFPKTLERAAKAIFQSSGVETAYESGKTPVVGLVDVSCIEELTTAYMLNGNTSVKQVRLPANVTVLGNQAFQNAKALTSVACGDAELVEGVADFSNTSLATIGKTVFSNVANIGTVKLPDTVTAISMVTVDGKGANISVFNNTGSAVIAEGEKLVVETPTLNEAVNNYASDEILGANIEYKYAN